MKPIKLFTDLSIHLYEGEAVKKRGTPVPPTPITYLTQWKIVGNSQVHTDPFLTSWKVSGNSVVDNNTILSCGDLGQDGKYHVKISNGVTIFDIPLTEPLRKINNVADTLKFPSDTEGKAVVTRRLLWNLMTEGSWKFSTYSGVIFSVSWASLITNSGSYSVASNIMAEGFNTYTYDQLTTKSYPKSLSIGNSNNALMIYDSDFIADGAITQAFADYIRGKHLLVELATPTTELIDVSSFPVSPTNTYTSANVVPYSAFEHTENKEIWSCGEYNVTDGKYHILVQPQGGSIADIALTEPLRKVNDIADTIEFPSNTEGKALVTRNLGGDKLGNFTWNASNTTDSSLKRWNTKSLQKVITASSVILTIEYTKGNTWNRVNKKYSYDSNDFFIYDNDYNTVDSYNDFIAHINNYDIIYELATPTTELVDAPQIQEADSYSMVISQGAKAVEWSSFETE